MPAVSDTSPISNLARIGRLGLLRTQFRDLWIPFAIIEELAAHPPGESLLAIQGALRDGWIQVAEAKNRRLLQLLSSSLDRGESAAKRLGLSSTGVLGILLRAKSDGAIPAVGPEISRLREQARFYVSRAIEEQILQIAGE